jgi:hypothetical protein
MRYRRDLRTDLRRALLGAVAALAPTAAPAQTQAADYPWCYIDQTKSGSTSCAFMTYAQCHENAGGNGGYCVQNPWWHGSPTAAPRRGRQR